MKIKKISADQVKVLIESEDINRYQVPYHKLSAGDDESVEFIYHLLFLIFDETGVSFLENVISVEAYPACAGNYYITITRTDEQGEGISLTKEDTRGQSAYIFCIEKLEHLEGVTAVLEQHPSFIPDASPLYKYNGKYYLLLDFSQQQTEKKEFSSFLLRLGEYMFPCKAVPENEGFLLERGKLICAALYPRNISPTSRTNYK